MDWSLFRRRAAIGLELPTPVRLSDLGFAREPSERVLLSRDRLDQFDADTLFFDVFRTGRRDEIVCIGPSLDGIAPAGLALSFAAEGLAGMSGRSDSCNQSPIEERSQLVVTALPP